VHEVVVVVVVVVVDVGEWDQAVGRRLEEAGKQHPRVLMEVDG
jgi:hypothetical protein